MPESLFLVVVGIGALVIGLPIVALLWFLSVYLMTSHPKMTVFCIVNFLGYAAAHDFAGRLVVLFFSTGMVTILAIIQTLWPSIRRQYLRGFVHLRRTLRQKGLAIKTATMVGLVVLVAFALTIAGSIR